MRDARTSTAVKPATGAPPRTPAPIYFACPDCNKALKARPALAGKEICCPGCGQGVRIPGGAPPPQPKSTRWVPLPAAFALGVVVFGCAIYVNLAYAVKDPANLRFFPPFKHGVNEAKGNQHLGGEYYQIARALVAGEGFSHPFAQPTGPTAWQGPVLPLLLAAVLWVTGDREGTAAIVVFFQVSIIFGTGLMVVALVRQTAQRIGAGVATVAFSLFLLCYFHLNFQFTHDCWINMLALDLVIAGLCWLQPLRSNRAAAGWGVFGGLCALTGPIVGIAWGATTIGHALRQRRWSHLGITLLLAATTVAPWTIRNLWVFGRLIPVKSNAAYEIYQSLCLQEGGLLQGKTFRHHPYSTVTKEGREYKRLGEAEYMDLKRRQVWDAICADPLDFLDRVSDRFLGATLWYVPMGQRDYRRPWMLALDRYLVHPLPFLSLLVLLASAASRPLQPAQWIVMSVYASFLLPYIATSYYDRYAVPLLGVKILLVLWAIDRLLCLRRAAPAHNPPAC